MRSVEQKPLHRKAIRLRIIVALGLLFGLTCGYLGSLPRDHTLSGFISPSGGDVVHHQNLPQNTSIVEFGFTFVPTQVSSGCVMEWRSGANHFALMLAGPTKLHLSGNAASSTSIDLTTAQDLRPGHPIFFRLIVYSGNQLEITATHDIFPLVDVTLPGWPSMDWSLGTALDGSNAIDGAVKDGYLRYRQPPFSWSRPLMTLAAIGSFLFILLGTRLWWWSFVSQLSAEYRFYRPSVPAAWQKVSTWVSDVSDVLLVFGHALLPILGVIVVVLFGVTLYISFQNPIYPDEFGYQLINARAFFDHFQYSSILPLCPSACSIPMPWSWYPGQGFWSAIYYAVENLRLFRLIGDGLFLLGFGILVALSTRLLDDRHIRIRVILTLGALCSLGVLPLILVFNRPEFILAVCIGWFCFAPLLSQRLSLTPRLRLLFSVIHLFAVSLFLASHPKTIMFVPLVVYSTARLGGLLFGRRGWWVGALVALIVSGQSYRVYSKSAKCPESQRVVMISSTQYVLLSADMFRHPAPVIESLWRNLLQYKTYLDQNVFCEHYPIEWLPGQPLTDTNRFINDNIRFVYESSTVFLIIVTLWFLWKPKGLRIASRQDVLLSALAILGAAGVASIQIAKNFYELGLFAPVVAVLIAWWATQLPQNSFWKKLGVFGYAGLLLISIQSQWAFANAFKEPFSENFAGKGIAVRSYDYSKIRSEVESAMAFAHLRNDPSTVHLVVDDLPYLFVKKTYQPYNSAYLDWAVVMDKGPQEIDSDDYFKILEGLHVSGIIGRCHYMEMVPAWNRHAHRFGDICVMGPDDIADAAKNSH